MKNILILLVIPMFFSCRDAVTTCTDYYKNGNKRMEVSFLNGQLYGTYTMWFENGNVHLQTIFENDSIVGLVELWHSNGIKAFEVDMEQSKSLILNPNDEIIGEFERKIIYGWLRFEANKLREKVKRDSLTYHKIKCLLFNTLV